MIAPRTKTVTLTFYRSELLYDCKNLAYVEGDVMPADDEHSRHQVMDIGEDGNIDRVTRVLDLAIAKCVELCYPYSKTPVGSATAMDDRLHETDAYVVVLLVPDDFSETTVTLLERLIHELLLCHVLADWMGLTNIANPKSAVTWQDKIEALEQSIRSTLNARIGRVRRTQSPF